MIRYAHLFSVVGFRKKSCFHPSYGDISNNMLPEGIKGDEESPSLIIFPTSGLLQRKVALF